MMTVAKQRRRTERDSSFENLSHLKSARPGSTSSSRNFHVRDVVNSANGETTRLSGQNEGCETGRKPRST